MNRDATTSSPPPDQPNPTLAGDGSAGDSSAGDGSAVSVTPRAGFAAPVALIGPTASGKSAVALAVAERRGDVDLISIDSMQVYRRMDIGTAKPTLDEQRRVRHHLIDLVDPADEFTVAEFQRAYRAALASVAASGRRALLVGGTGLYHRAIVDDLELPGEWPELRRDLEAELAGHRDPARMYQRLKMLDPYGASRIEPGNERRIIRALEVTIGSGRRFSSFGPGLDAYPENSIRQIGLRWDRTRLSQRIERRVVAMIDAGLVEEVAGLRSAGLSRTAAQALGYKELFGYLDGEISRDEAIERIVIRTRQFAVRQERWFRRDPRVQWIDIDQDPVAEVTPIVVTALDSVAAAQPTSAALSPRSAQGDL